jgi:hypothetical protein
MNGGKMEMRMDVKSAPAAFLSGTCMLLLQERWDVQSLRGESVRYCSSLTCSNHSTALPFSAS